MASVDSWVEPVRTRRWVSVLITSLFVFVLPGLGTLAALASLVLGQATLFHLGLFILGFLATGLGITVGYHRMLTHRSFETHPAIKAILLIMGSMAVEGPANAWVANHLKHHLFSDQEGDPHSPRRGLFHSHWGWLSDFSDIDLERYGGRVQRDRISTWVSKTFALWVTAGYVIPFLIGGGLALANFGGTLAEGYPDAIRFLVGGGIGLAWGGLFRQLAVQNVTFAVNSVCHRWGSRPFNTTDLSRNNWFVGLTGLGEGWHNNHHAFPASAFHGLRWWEFDLSGQVIQLLESLRLAWNVRRPDLSQIQRKLFEPALATQYARVTQ
ncbi:MAG TPA: acyl-CoA desaturase [Chloroflexota bacterium]